MCGDLRTLKTIELTVTLTFKAFDLREGVDVVCFRSKAKYVVTFGLVDSDSFELVGFH
jgi:hypothetical protein